MNQKRILVDLSVLKDLNCGLGQVAFNYGEYFRKNYSGEGFDLYLFLPKKFVGTFGNQVKYVAVNRWYKTFPFLMPKVDVWHAIHQLCRYHPASKHTKYLLTIHDFNFVYEKKDKEKVEKYLNKIQKKIDNAYKITCISQFAKSETEKFANTGGKQIEVILNGVEQMDGSKGEKPAFIKDDKQTFFFTIGQIKRKKNFHALLDLMKLFPDKFLYIAGKDDTGYAQFIRDRIQAENINNVVVAGSVSPTERIWLYNHCEAFLFPSLFEGFGLPVIEALSFGKPVFSSQETSLKEIGGKHVFFWKNFEPESMKKVIDDNLRKFYETPELIQENKEYAQSFSYEKHMESYMKIYHELLE